MATTMRAAIRHHGFSLVDVLQQCVTFNKVNTFGWYKERVQKLPDDYDPTDRQAAFAKALEWGDHIPIGVLYVHERPSYSDLHPALHDKPALWKNWTTDMAPYGALLDEMA
jgi:2-oxoglutarate ferredoxin oxidoreductase subunit beta